MSVAVLSPCALDRAPVLLPQHSSRPDRDAGVRRLTPRGPAPQLFALWDGQRKPRCYGRVPHPWPSDRAAVTERQLHVRTHARRWFVVEHQGLRAILDLGKNARGGGR